MILCLNISVWLECAVTSGRIPASRKWLDLQLNRAIRYILYARSRAAGTQGESPAKGGQAAGGRSEHGQRRKAAYGKAAGHEPHTGMMILASAMRHSVGRPATGMGGGTNDPMERICQPPSEVAFVLYREQENTAPPSDTKFVVNASHRETHFL